jgi:hypothetical protein
MKNTTKNAIIREGALVRILGSSARHAALGIAVATALFVTLGILGAPALANTVTISCVGDGVTDDTACLSSAFAEGSTIDFPAGKTYLVSHGSLNAGSNKVFNGNGSKLTCDTGLQCLSVDGSNITIRDLGVDGGSAVEGGDLWIGAGASDITIAGGTFSGSSPAGILINGLHIANVTISGITASGVEFGILTNNICTNDTNPADYPTNITITGNTITNVGGDAIEINSPVGLPGGTTCQGSTVLYGSGVPGAAINHLLIEGNTLEALNSNSSGAGFCIGIAGATDVLAWSNTMSNCKWQGIHIEDHATRIYVVGNTIGGPTLTGTIGPKSSDVSSWAASDSSCILAISGSGDSSIVDNAMYNCVGSGVESSTGGSYPPPHDTIISQNHTYTVGQYGIGWFANAGSTTIGRSGTFAGNVTSSSGLGSISGCGGDVACSGNTGN